MGSLSLLQRIFTTQESNPGLLHCRQILYQLSYEGSPSMIIPILQMRKLRSKEVEYFCTGHTESAATDEGRVFLTLRIPACHFRRGGCEAGLEGGALHRPLSRAHPHPTPRPCLPGFTSKLHARRRSQPTLVLPPPQPQPSLAPSSAPTPPGVCPSVPCAGSARWTRSTAHRGVRPALHPMASAQPLSGETHTDTISVSLALSSRQAQSRL